MTEEEIIGFGYLNPRQLTSGEWMAWAPSIYTADLYVGLDAVGWRVKWMYPAAAECILACAAWDGTGHPPGNWIKRKDRHGDAWNPAAYKPERDVNGDQLVACEDGSVRRGKP